LAVLPEILQNDDALQRVAGFARRYGEAHVLLAMHAALPLGLTPDLLHLVRINFVNGAPWIAEADLLLSPLCEEVGGELYEMTSEARELLLDELRSDPEFGPPRIKAVGEFLVEYAIRTRSGSTKLVTDEMRDFYQALEWVGLAYARPEEAAHSLALALRKGLHDEDHGEIVRVASLTEALTAPLLSEDRILLYSAGVKHLAAGDVHHAQPLFEALGPLDQPTRIGGLELPSPGSLMESPVAQVSEAEATATTAGTTVIENEPAPAEVATPVRKPEPAIPPSSGLSERDWDSLIHDIQKGRCTPVIGNGAAYGILPSQREIAVQWADEYDLPIVEPYDLARVAQFVNVRYGDDLRAKEKIAELFGRYDANSIQAESVFGILAELPIPIYLTFDFHDLMARALMGRQKSPQAELCRWNPFLEKDGSSDSNDEPTVEGPTVFHFYGFAQLPESLVLTEDDYLNFIFNVAKRTRVIPPRIQRALTSTSLLFLGSDFDSRGLRIFLRVIDPYLKNSLRRSSYIQLMSPVKPSVENDIEFNARRYIELYFQKNDMRVFWGTSEDFCKELRERWREARQHES
jgi:SIR2-like domain